MQFDINDFEKLKERSETLYNELTEVYCPYFKEKIYFNWQGLYHLEFKRRKKVRPIQDQYMRLKLLYLAPEIIKLSHTIQGHFETKGFERIRIHSRTETKLISVSYYEFLAVIKRNRVKIILKQIGEGEKFFWSIIPYWGMDLNTKLRRLYDGQPEED